MRGEETVHTDLLLNQFGIVALTGGMLRHPHFEVMRFGIGKSFLLFFFRSWFMVTGILYLLFCSDPTLRQMSWKNRAYYLSGSHNLFAI